MGRGVKKERYERIGILRRSFSESPAPSFREGAVRVAVVTT